MRKGRDARCHPQRAPESNGVNGAWRMRAQGFQADGPMANQIPDRNVDRRQPMATPPRHDAGLRSVGPNRGGRSRNHQGIVGQKRGRADGFRMTRSEVSAVFHALHDFRLAPPVLQHAGRSAGLSSDHARRIERRHRKQHQFPSEIRCAHDRRSRQARRAATTSATSATLDRR